MDTPQNRTSDLLVRSKSDVYQHLAHFMSSHFVSSSETAVVKLFVTDSRIDGMVSANGCVDYKRGSEKRMRIGWML